MFSDASSTTICCVPVVLDRARALMASAQRITVLTGAGISTDSGIPDFRGPQGLWTRNPGAERMATIDHYLADPGVRRASWQNRLSSPAWIARPNPGHRALVDLEQAAVWAGENPGLLPQITAAYALCLGSRPDRFPRWLGLAQRAWSSWLATARPGAG